VMNATLQNWFLNGWLMPHKTSSQEIADLFAVVDRDLADCRSPGLSADWRLNIAYNAALQAATAALAVSGCRAARAAHHFRVIQSLAHTIGAPTGLVNLFDLYRKKRNIGGYERAGAISNQEADEMFSLAKKIRDDVETWIRSVRPELIGE
jgi:hypothetical protein